MFDTAQQLIIERAKHPEFAGTLENADLAGDGANPFCGDEVHLEVRTEHGRITELRHRTRACTICAAAADLLAEAAAGKTLEEARAIQSEEITDSLAIPLSPTRLKCALLPLETLKQILEQA